MNRIRRFGALGATGDVELGNHVTSVNGMRIFPSNGTPSAGNYHDGDLSVDYSVTPAHLWNYAAGAWHKII